MCNECHLSIDPYKEIVFLDAEGQLHCLGGPAVICEDGYVAYFVHGKRHRDGDEPAVIYANGHVEYWVNGKRHRDAGPARIWADGTTQYWVNGELS